MIDSFAAAVEASQLGMVARGSAWAYPIANLVHLLGLVLLVGGIGILDLRILGAFPSLPLPALSRALTPLAIAGLILMLPSGLVLFAADAGALVGSDRFRLKLVLIALALANALAFRVVGRADARPTGTMRLMAAVSLALWLGVAALGRLIAYS
ncbi:hypothetical protein [Sphingomonas sanxanigenens]|uniref:DUF2214 domain-containing protein n=1 Tax=Sphingomonas sanxanigenens DSM 19645 = NX02 TaxID=1123269 RepID=W0AEE0_9SPHN|nr:hypothetical protein [Sphingomonas sanxanigenens]AHE54917.1 hypothetical protein NX02_16185 [Sphingomonas sanxanigenens DSM 19645 = NX02]